MLWLGIGLFVLTVSVGLAIINKANQNVRNFKEHEHEIFVGFEDK